MKIEIGRECPAVLKEEWIGKFDLFSPLEFVAGVPGPLSLITTRKENGLSNACFHAWGSFVGDGGGFFAILPGLCQHTHTYAHLQRDSEFCVNFLAPAHYDACMATIRCGDGCGPEDDADELLHAQLTPETAKTVNAPRVAEAFLVYECRVKSITDLSGAGKTALVVGEVLHAAAESGSRDLAKITGEDGFMFNIHSPADAVTGVIAPMGVAALSLVKTL